MRPEMQSVVSPATISGMSTTHEQDTDNARLDLGVLTQQIQGAGYEATLQEND